MAEIKIEKKSPVWPWIIVIIVLLAIIAYFIYSKDNDNDDTMYDNDTNSEVMDSISDINEEGYGTTAPYMVDSTTLVREFTNSISDTTRIGKDSIYTKTAIINLAKIVSMKADELNVQPSMALKNLKDYSNQLSETYDPQIADSSKVAASDVDINLKTASTDIVTVLETIQTNNYPSLQDEVLELKQTSKKIENNVATKEQQNTLQTFFAKAKEVVNNMNT